VLEHDVVLPDPFTSVYANGLDDSDTHSHAVYELNFVGATDSSYGTPINGVLRTEDPEKSLTKGIDTLYVLYPDGSFCDPNGIREDCFAGPKGGAILEGYGAVDYTYDPKIDNKFAYSLKGFSEEEGLRMYYCEHHGGCGYEEYQHFFDYYGVLDYGNHWIESAFAGTGTDYNGKNSFARGNVDFSVFSDSARVAAIKTATVALNVFTAVNRLMVEYAVSGCKKNSKDYESHGNSHSMDSVIDAWDQAVATYAGSELFWNDEGSESSTGSLYYNLVDELAKDFGVTNHKAFPHTSTVNKYIMDEFLQGKAQLLQGDCQDMGGVTRSYYTIIHKMRTPLIQGVLRSAFVLSAEEDYFNKQRREEEHGKGAAFLSALLPDLHMCNPTSAQKVFDEFHGTYGSNKRADYYTIRELIEPHYECLSVTCDEVGGFLDPATGDYYPGTHPCGGYGKMTTQRRDSVVEPVTSQVPKSSPPPASKGLSVSSFFGVALMVFGASLAVLVVVVRDQAQGRPVSVVGAAQRLASGAVGTADYWLSRRNHNFHGGHHYELHRETNGYDLQLRSMGEPLQVRSNDNDHELLL